ncbi:MAG: patatin-like phospholipase family protein [Pseudomonadota bacterium]
MLRLLAIIGLFALSACSTGSPTGPTCVALESFGGSDASARAAALSDGMGAALEDDIANAMSAPMAARASARRSVLAISAGGQNGAFASGFLTGWTARGDRPDFDIVTGASAGALVAPVAFLGPDFDADLRRNTGIGDEDIFRRRGTLTALLSTSFFDTAPLERRVQALYARTDFWDALIAQTQSRRLLLIGATDIETGRFQRFDFASLLRAEKPVDAKKECLVEATLASAAIPGFFPPRKINDRLFVDAGVRQAIFLDEIVEELNARRGAGGTDVYLLINGTLEFPDSAVEPRLLSLVGRNLEILTDEGMRASILRVLARAELNGWTLRAAAIEELPECSDADGAFFSRCVTEGLFDHGQELAQRADPWLSVRELRDALEQGRVER